MKDNSLFAAYCSQKRSYYRIPIKAEELFDEGNSKDKCKEFIKEHFRRGHKGYALSIPNAFKSLYEEKGKHPHTVSLFLLGLTLRRCFEESLRGKLDDLFTDNSWFDFIYSWYLTCLYHDVASCIEDKKDNNPNNPDAFDTFSEITESYFFQTPDNLRRFKKQTVLNYLKYRLSDNKYDHGITGGIKLYEALLRSFAKDTQMVDWNKTPVWYKDGLCWRREHLSHSAYIADAICCHNIWMAYDTHPERVAMYREKGLSELVITSPEDRLHLNDYPLQFMLCLLDTIEPVKRFINLSAEEVLKNISIRVYHPGRITISWNKTIKEQPQFYKWLSDLHELQDWMNVTVSACHCKNSGCSINIIINELADRREVIATPSTM